MPGPSDVQTDDEGAHDLDLVPLDAPHGGGKVAASLKVELLAEFPQPFRRQRLEADEDAPAAGSCGQRQHLLVVGEIDRGLGDPFLAQVRLDHGAEQVLGAGDVLGSRCR